MATSTCSRSDSVCSRSPSCSGSSKSSGGWQTEEIFAAQNEIAPVLWRRCGNVWRVSPQSAKPDENVIQTKIEKNRKVVIKTKIKKNSEGRWLVRSRWAEYAGALGVGVVGR